MKTGIATDHGGYELKGITQAFPLKTEYEVVDFGAYKPEDNDDYPHFIIPLSKDVAANEVEGGIAICGSGVGASVVANKIPGVRAALIGNHFPAHQGVEDDDMNIIYLGGRVTGFASAEELILTFLKVRFNGAERHLRRLQKTTQIEINLHDDGKNNRETINYHT